MPDGGAGGTSTEGALLARRKSDVCQVAGFVTVTGDWVECTVLRIGDTDRRHLQAAEMDGRTADQREQFGFGLATDDGLIAFAQSGIELAQALDLLFCPFAVGDVARDTERADDFAVAIAQRTLGRNEEPLAIHRRDLLLEGADPVFIDGAAIIGANVLGVLGGEDVRVPPPDDEFSRFADDTRGRPVGQQVATFLVLGEDGVSRIVDDR